MFRIKRLYSFILSTFFPLLLATFSVCLFVLLMQFLWKYVDDLVGKGVGMKILAEMFFYAANYLIPTALPIGILLSSLMTFGSLGEHLELLAMKSSGISLIRIMKPLIYLVIILAGITFVYQNNISPNVHTKLWTIVYSIRQKAPELDIPVKSFCNEITGYSMYVQSKDKSGLLREVMVYDYSNGFDKLIVTKSDSGRLKMSDDKKYLIMTLYNGESFQNMGMNKSQFNPNQVPFQRQSFRTQVILIDFDSNLNMADESIMKNREFSKNIPELRSFIYHESISDDSLAREINPLLKGQVYEATFKQGYSVPQANKAQIDTLPVGNFELFYNSLPDNQKIQILESAKAKVERITNEFNFRMFPQTDNQRQIRLHQIELHRKFAYAIACLLFFFIGAPLGAIIRKGGLGMPAVLSVFIFIMYYTIEEFGRKMVRQDLWPAWEGVWMSSLVIGSLGIFLTYKAVNDSVVMNIDAWKENLLRLFGKREIRNYSQKEIIIYRPDYHEAIRIMEKWNEEVSFYLKQKKKIPFYISFWKQNFQDLELIRLLTNMDNLIEDLLNSNENLIIGKLMDYPVITPYSLLFLNRPAVRWSCSIIFPIGILIYIFCLLKQKQINTDLKISMKVNEEICTELRNMKLDCINN